LSTIIMAEEPDQIGPDMTPKKTFGEKAGGIVKTIKHSLFTR